MKKLAILGHPTEGNKVIEILEMLGGNNKNGWECKNPRLVYYIDNDTGLIEFINTCNLNEDILRYTLEGFLEKYPYKIGDKVRIPKFKSEICIDNMRWDPTCQEIEYAIETEWYRARELNKWNIEIKESSNPTLLQLKKYFEETPKDIIEKEWHEYDKYNEVGPAVDKYLKYVNTIRQPQYPKTYKECCEVLGLDTMDNDAQGYEANLIICFQELLIARNAYWKIAGKQMGLDKPWEPDFKDDSDKYFICYLKDEIWKSNIRDCNRFLVFPTEKIRDEFYENFKDSIKICKNLI